MPKMKWHNGTGWEALDAANADTVDGKTPEDIFSTAERSKLSGIAAGAEVNAVDSVAGQTGVVTLDADDVSETTGKKWMTSAERTKLTAIESGAQVNDVDSVNGKTGAVTLTAADVGAIDSAYESGTTAPTDTSKLWIDTN